MDSAPGWDNMKHSSSLEITTSPIFGIEERGQLLSNEYCLPNDMRIWDFRAWDSIGWGVKKHTAIGCDGRRSDILECTIVHS